MNNKNKIALITGAAQRIGKAIAQELHSQGIDVAIHYGHSLKEAEILKKELNTIRSNSAEVFQYDLSGKESPKKLINNVKRHFGRIDYLVNNASIFYPTPFNQYKKEDLDSFLQINFFQTVKLSQLAYPLLKQNSGSIVNIIDIYAQRGLEDHTAYVASKAALLEATKNLAIEFAPEVTVNAVSPGAILWPESDVDLNHESQQLIIQNTALKRRGQVKDISKTVAYLLTQANYSTGSLINVDGGRRLYI